MLFLISMLLVPLVFLAFGIRIVRPVYRGVVERFGRYTRLVQPGLTWIIPIIETMRYRNITERLNDVQPQDIITKDNLNARVDLQVYTRIRNTEEDIKKSYYQVEDYKQQILALAQTTTRNVIGDMKFIEVNNQRNELNKRLAEIIAGQIINWGVEVVRVELKEITPPKDVQETMNKVIKAQNEKDAAVDFATAAETKADGERRASIKEAEGIKQAKILQAEGEAEAIKLVNEAAQRYFKDEAIQLRQLEVTENALKNNAKIIVTDKGIVPQLIIGELPLKTSQNVSNRG